ncbi:hypothetical protein CDL15_Pgr024297 [Punica granatum]|uniref:Uncharacterized protein n=1 Tax=Punica granatum TaxID=22663 RepID=A0A218XY89_PUNGR|nr:hypothetical protein CDL15_Pgr024297 [Punica granatum]
MGSSSGLFAGNLPSRGGQPEWSTTPTTLLGQEVTNMGAVSSSPLHSLCEASDDLALGGGRWWRSSGGGSLASP